MKHFLKWFILVLALTLLFTTTKHYAFADGEEITPTSCSDTYPTDAPNLYQVVSSSSSATLYFVEPKSEFDGYTISYGTTSSAESYNTTFSYSRTGAATSYTVNNLTPKTTYYFKVRANKGCATGPWSNSLSSSGAELPKTGPDNTMMAVGLGAFGLIVLGLSLFLLL